MKRILVPTDFSDNAFKAAIYASEICKRTGAELFLLHVIESGDQRFIQTVSMYQKFNNMVWEDRESSLLESVQRIGNQYPEVNIKYFLEGVDDTTRYITAFSSQHNIDLVVMGTKGASGLKEFLLGSTTASVIAKTRVPVLAVPAEYSLEEPDAIILATNHFKTEYQLLQPLVHLVDLFRSDLHIITFLENDDADAADYVTAGRKLLTFEEFVRNNFPSLKIQTRLLEGTDFEDAIRLYCIEKGIDIVALLSYPKTFTERLFGKSAARKMSLHSRVPVLVIPATE